MTVLDWAAAPQSAAILVYTDDSDMTSGVQIVLTVDEVIWLALHVADAVENAENGLRYEAPAPSMSV
jgi:hypothetical protein